MRGEDTPPGEDDPHATLRGALTAVRREALKAGVVYATLDGAILAIAVDGVLTLAGLAQQPIAGPVALSTGIGLLAGIAVFGAELLYRFRDPVERFEAANPGLAPALRTARDTAAHGVDGPMVRALYRETVGRLRHSSGTALLDARRLLGTVLGLLVVSGLVIGTAGVDVGSIPGLGGDGGNPSGTGTPTPDGPLGGAPGLRGGGAVLGDAANVSNGSDPLEASVPASGGSSGESLARDYDSSGLPVGAREVDVQRAGFAEQERVEDADIIRAYNLRIRGESDD